MLEVYAIQESISEHNFYLPSSTASKGESDSICDHLGSRQDLMILSRDTTTDP